MHQVEKLLQQLEHKQDEESVSLRIFVKSTILEKCQNASIKTKNAYMGILDLVNIRQYLVFLIVLVWNVNSV